MRGARRARLWARLRFAAYALRVLTSRLGIVVALTLGFAAVFYFQGQGKDYIDACYQVYAQLFFEHTEPLPKDGLIRGLYFVLPLLGALVLAEGLLKVGASFLDFENHREIYVKMLADSMQDHVVLVGLGNVGFRVLGELLARKTQVVVIEGKDSGHFVEEAQAAGVCVLHGDARRKGLLNEAGIERARAVIACTDNDLVNLEICVDAKRDNPRARLVMRMFDQELAQKLGDAFTLDHSFSTSALSAPIFAAAALDTMIHGAFRLGDDLVVAAEVELGPAHVGKTVVELRKVLKAPVVGVVRKGDKPTGSFDDDVPLAEGDRVVCQVPSDQLGALRARATKAESGY